MVVLFGAAGEIRSRCYHTATRNAAKRCQWQRKCAACEGVGTKRPTGAFFRFAHALFESLDTKKNTTLLGGVLFGAAGEIRTLGTLLTYTRFPVVLVMTASILLRIGALDSKNDYTKNHSKVKHKFEKCAIF